MPALVLFQTPPEALPSEAELKALLIDRVPPQVKAYWERERPIEIRPVDLSRYLSPENRAPSQQVWIRATGKFPEFWDVGISVFLEIYDWHIRERQPIQISRIAGRV